MGHGDVRAHTLQPRQRTGARTPRTHTLPPFMPTRAAHRHCAHAHAHAQLGMKDGDVVDAVDEVREIRESAGVCVCEMDRERKGERKSGEREAERAASSGAGRRVLSA
jgi:hypothetical protein